jgi:hypothetical protein
MIALVFLFLVFHLFLLHLKTVVKNILIIPKPDITRNSAGFIAQRCLPEKQWMLNVKYGCLNGVHSLNKHTNIFYET